MCACHQFGYFRIPSASSIQHLVPETRYASSKISSSRPISGRNWKDHQDQQVARWGSKGPRGQMTTSSNLLMNYIGSFFSLNSLPPPPLASYGHWEVISHYWPHERGGGKRGRGRWGGGHLDPRWTRWWYSEKSENLDKWWLPSTQDVGKCPELNYLHSFSHTDLHTHTHTHTHSYIYIYIYMYIYREKKREI